MTFKVIHMTNHYNSGYYHYNQGKDNYQPHLPCYQIHLCIFIDLNRRRRKNKNFFFLLFFFSSCLLISFQLPPADDCIQMTMSTWLHYKATYTSILGQNTDVCDDVLCIYEGLEPPVHRSKCRGLWPSNQNKSGI